MMVKTRTFRAGIVLVAVLFVRYGGGAGSAGYTPKGVSKTERPRTVRTT